MKLPLILFVAVIATGCTSYRALTAPPPSRTAALDNAHDELRVSQGVALAFTCVTGWGNPCNAADATVDDEKIAKAFPAHLNRVEGYLDGSFQPTSYVVVGVTPGETTLRIAGEDPVKVVVVP